MFDPVDPNTVYVSFFCSRHLAVAAISGTRGSRSFARVGPATGTAERAEFDVVQLGGETRMYVGVGGGGVFAHFRRNDAVRSRPPRRRGRRWIT